MVKILIISVACLLLAVQAFSDDSYMHPDVKHKNPRMSGKQYESVESWKTSAQDALGKKLKEERTIGEAKNVIMFLGDGWGVTTMTAARVLKGQEVQKVPFGEEGTLHVDTFPVSGTSKTYCVDSQVADSACSATAYLCGVKANEGTMGVTSDVLRHNCTAQQMQKNHVSSILAWAQAAGKSTGVVTTTRITHASPGGTYSHIANRDWESDADIALRGENPVDCDDIAEQLILQSPGRDIDVILGGGRRKFLPNNVRDAEGFPGDREDGKNLIDEWKKYKTEDGARADVNATIVNSVDELLRVDATRTDALFGLFASDHIEYYHEQEANNDPSLTVMTEAAIKILKKNPNGFFLFVEGGRIDHAHHENWGLRSLWEAVEFDRAIEKGDELTDDDDTLIVVTADHSHAFNFAGYADRGSPMSGFGGVGFDYLLPYTTMNYANGPGWKPFTDGKRHDMRNDEIHNLTYRQTPLVHLDSETHGGEDVMIFAKGPFSHLLSGVQQQNYIPHVMAYASCVGDGLKYCTQEPTTTSEGTTTEGKISTTTPSHSNINTASAAFTFAVLFVLKVIVQI